MTVEIKRCESQVSGGCNFCSDTQPLGTAPVLVLTKPGGLQVRFCRQCFAVVVDTARTLGMHGTATQVKQAKLKDELVMKMRAMFRRADREGFLVGMAKHVSGPKMEEGPNVKRMREIVEELK